MTQHHVCHPFAPPTVVIPAGAFMMGSDPARDPQACHSERPAHAVTLPAYAIGRFPVTVGEFRAFVAAGGYHQRHYWTDAGWAHRQRAGWAGPQDDLAGNDDRLPVAGVSWYEAMAYCAWLADVTGRPFRLPGEAEWEKAARGPEARIYPWGDGWHTDRCNSREAGLGQRTPVGHFSPAGDSPYGVADMGGNVWEWCRSRFRSYPRPEDNTPDGDGTRVVRGGAWNNYQDVTRAANRSGNDPHIRLDSQGFRVALARN